MLNTDAQGKAISGQGYCNSRDCNRWFSRQTINVRLTGCKSRPKISGHLGSGSSRTLHLHGCSNLHISCRHCSLSITRCLQSDVSLFGHVCMAEQIKQVEVCYPQLLTKQLLQNVCNIQTKRPKQQMKCFCHKQAVYRDPHYCWSSACLRTLSNA